MPKLVSILGAYFFAIRWSTWSIGSACGKSRSGVLSLAVNRFGAKNLRRSKRCVVDFGDLSEREKRAVLFEVDAITKEGLTPVPIMVEVSLPKTIRLFNAVWLSRRRARSFFLDALVIRRELDRLFRVKVFRVRMPRKKSERQAQSSHKPRKISEHLTMP